MSRHLRFETAYIFDDGANVELRSEEFAGFRYMKDNFPLLLHLSRLTGLRKPVYMPSDRGPSQGSSAGAQDRLFRRGSVRALVGGTTTLECAARTSPLEEFDTDLDEAGDSSTADCVVDLRSKEQKYATVCNTSCSSGRRSPVSSTIVGAALADPHERGGSGTSTSGSPPLSRADCVEYFDSDTFRWRCVDAAVPAFWTLVFLLNFATVLAMVAATRPSPGLIVSFFACAGNGLAKFVTWRYGCDFRQSICSVFSGFQTHTRSQDAEDAKAFVSAFSPGGAPRRVSAPPLPAFDASSHASPPLALRLANWNFLGMFPVILSWAVVFVAWYELYPTDWNLGSGFMGTGMFASSYSIPFACGALMATSALLQVVATMGVFYCTCVAIIIRLKKLRRDISREVHDAILDVEEPRPADDSAGRPASGAGRKQEDKRAHVRETICKWILEYQRHRAMVQNFSDGTQYYYFVAEFLIVMCVFGAIFDLFKHPHGQEERLFQEKLALYPEVYGDGYFSFYRFWLILWVTMIVNVLVGILLMASQISDEGSRVRERSLPFQYLEIEPRKNFHKSRPTSRGGAVPTPFMMGVADSAWGSAASTTKANHLDRSAFHKILTTGENTATSQYAVGAQTLYDHADSFVDPDSQEVDHEEVIILLLERFQEVMHKNPIEYKAFGMLINTSNILRVFYILVSGIAFCYVEMT